MLAIFQKYPTVLDCQRACRFILTTVFQAFEAPLDKLQQYGGSTVVQEQKMISQQISSIQATAISQKFCIVGADSKCLVTGKQRRMPFDLGLYGKKPNPCHHSVGGEKPLHLACTSQAVFVGISFWPHVNIHIKSHLLLCSGRIKWIVLSRLFSLLILLLAPVSVALRLRLY